MGRHVIAVSATIVAMVLACALPARASPPPTCPLTNEKFERSDTVGIAKVVKASSVFGPRKTGQAGAPAKALSSLVEASDRWETKTLSFHLIKKIKGSFLPENFDISVGKWESRDYYLDQLPDSAGSVNIVFLLNQNGKISPALDRCSFTRIILPQNFIVPDFMPADGAQQEDSKKVFYHLLASTFLTQDSDIKNALSRQTHADNAARNWHNTLNYDDNPAQLLASAHFERWIIALSDLDAPIIANSLSQIVPATIFSLHDHTGYIWIAILGFQLRNPRLIKYAIGLVSHLREMPAPTKARYLESLSDYITVFDDVRLATAFSGSIDPSLRLVAVAGLGRMDNLDAPSVSMRQKTLDLLAIDPNEKVRKAARVAITELSQ